VPSTRPDMPICRHLCILGAADLLLAMQKVEGSNPFSRSRKRPAFAGLFRGRSRLVRLRHRTMTGQSCLWRLACAIGRCSLAGDSERPAPWNFCVPAADRHRPRRVGAPAHRHPSAFSVVAMQPSSRSSTLNLRSCSSSDARARAGSAATPASAQEGHSCRDRRECSSHGNPTLWGVAHSRRRASVANTRRE